MAFGLCWGNRRDLSSVHESSSLCDLAGTLVAAQGPATANCSDLSIGNMVVLGDSVVVVKERES